MNLEIHGHPARSLPGSGRFMRYPLLIVAALALGWLSVPSRTRADDTPPVETYDATDPLVITRWRVDAEYIAEVRWQFIPGVGWQPVIVYRIEIITASWG